MKTDEEIEDKEGVKSEHTAAENNVKDPPSNPLEKYMRIIQQSRAQELANKVIILRTWSQKYYRPNLCLARHA